MFTPELISHLQEAIEDGDSWYIAQHPELYREAERLVREGKSPEALAAVAARLFSFDNGDEAHVLAVLREHAAECERYRTEPTIIHFPG
jgi:hypothetical protein